MALISENLEIVRGGEELLDRTAPLWERLRDHHRVRAGRFAAWFARHTFAYRRDELLRKAAGGALLGEIARDAATGRDVGYCISSLDAEGQGEIESIFVEEVYRHQGLGRLPPPDPLRVVPVEGRHDPRHPHLPGQSGESGLLVEDGVCTVCGEDAMRTGVKTNCGGASAAPFKHSSL
ncbi:MAG: hypothetical protein ACUVRM_10200 [Bacillota bacterium]